MSGKIESFPSWEYMMDMHMNREHKHFIKCIRWMEEGEKKVKVEDLEEFQRTSSGDVGCMLEKLFSAV